MKCPNPKCRMQTKATGVLETRVDNPGRKEYLQRRVCGTCGLHFKVEVILDAARLPEPPEAA